MGNGTSAPFPPPFYLAFPDAAHTLSPTDHSSPPRVSKVGKKERKKRRDKKPSCEHACLLCFIKNASKKPRSQTWRASTSSPILFLHCPRFPTGQFSRDKQLPDPLPYRTSFFQRQTRKTNSRLKSIKSEQQFPLLCAPL